MSQLTEDDFIKLLIGCGEEMTKANETTWRTVWQHRNDMDMFLGTYTFDRTRKGNARTLIDGEVVTFEQILAEGQKSTPQFNEWHDIFDLQSVCYKLGLSELEKWCVLGNRFRVVDRKNDNEATEFAKWCIKNRYITVGDDCWRKRADERLLTSKELYNLWKNQP